MSDVSRTKLCKRDNKLDRVVDSLLSSRYGVVHPSNWNHVFYFVSTSQKLLCLGIFESIKKHVFLPFFLNCQELIFSLLQKIIQNLHIRFTDRVFSALNCNERGICSGAFPSFNNPLICE